MSDIMEIIETTQSNCRIFIVKGKLDVLTAPLLRETLMARIEEGAAQLLVNCTLLDYISSAGLRVLYEALAKLEASRAHGALRRQQQRKILDAVDLCTDIPAFATEAEALQHLNAK